MTVPFLPRRGPPTHDQIRSCLKGSWSNQWRTQGNQLTCPSFPLSCPSMPLFSSTQTLDPCWWRSSWKCCWKKEGTVMQQNDRYLEQNLKHYPTHRCRLYESVHITTDIFLLQQLTSESGQSSVLWRFFENAFARKDVRLKQRSKISGKPGRPVSFKKEEELHSSTIVCTRLYIWT